MFGSVYNRNIFLCILFLSGLGLIQVYSSTYIFAVENYDSGLFFLKKQLIFVLIGFLSLFILSVIPWKYNRYIGMGAWLSSVLALILTLIPQVGISVSGAQRWLPLPFGMRFQPAELLKVTTPFILAYFVVLYEKWPLQKLLFWTIPFFSLAFPILMLILQPDFGTVAIILMLAFAVIFVLGLSWRYIILGSSMIGALFYYLIVSRSYRFARIEGFLDPWADPLGKGFQVIQSLLSVHSGGLFGTGLGKGQSKLFFLPEAHTDFTLAVLAEEIGFIGLLFVFGVYAYLVFNCMKVILKTYDFYQKVLSYGLIIIFSAGVIIHTAVNLGLLPTKGLALPFLSYGGSSLVSTFLLFGWFFSLEKSNR